MAPPQLVLAIFAVLSVTTVPLSFAQTGVLRSSLAFPQTAIHDVVVDSSGDIYITGDTSWQALSTTPGASQKTTQGGMCLHGWQWSFPCTDAFVAKFSGPDLSLVYATYLGGNRNDSAFAIVADEDGNAVITGTTSSSDFPTTPNVVQFGGYHFTAKFNSHGSLIYSVRGVGGAAIVMDDEGSTYTAGSTSDAGYPVTSGAYRTTFPQTLWGQGVVTKLDRNGSLVYSTFMGGTGYESFSGIAVDAGGSAYVTGWTASPDFPVTPNALQPPRSATPMFSDAFVFKLDATGSRLVYSTLLGGATSNDWGRQIAVDAKGNVHVLGTTQSSDFPVTPGAFQPHLTGNPNLFVAKISPDGSRLLASTFLGGEAGEDWTGRLALRDRNVYVSAGTASRRFPTTPTAQERCLPGEPRPYGSVLAVLSSNVSRLLRSTFTPGPIFALAPNGHVYVVAHSEPSGPGSGQGFVAEFDLSAPRPSGIDCVVHAANYASGIVGPGMLVTIFGAGLRSASGVIASPENVSSVPTRLAGTRVLFDGVAAPLLYVSDSQINAVAPFSLEGKSSTQLEVEYEGEITGTTNLKTQNSFPGIFTIGYSNRGAVLNEDGTLNSPANPAARGSILSYWITGAGPLEPPGADGRIATDASVRVREPITAYFWGWQADVFYAGAAPGMVAGVVQVNVRIPAALQLTRVSDVDISVRIGDRGGLAQGVSVAPVFVAIK